MGKTGSSSIQSALYAARLNLLATERILYPSVAANHSSYLRTIFADEIASNLIRREPTATDENVLANIKKDYRAALEEDLVRPGWHRVVISAEGLINFTPAAVTRFLSWLRAYVSDVYVVAFVRHPVEWERSMTQQRLKKGDTLKGIFESLRGPKWRRRFSPWLSEVGIERCRLISFDEARLNEGIVAAFCEAADLPSNKILPLAPTTVVNESMSLEAMLLLDSINRQQPLFRDGELSPKRRWGDVPLLKSIPGNRFEFDSEQTLQVRRNSRPDLNWLNDTFQVDLYPDVFEDTVHGSPDVPTTMPQETVEALARTLSSLGNRAMKRKDRDV